MRKKYIGGDYTLVIEDKDGKPFTFNDIVLSAKDVQQIWKTMTFFNCRVKEISAHSGEMVVWK